MEACYSPLARSHRVSDRNNDPQNYHLSQVDRLRKWRDDALSQHQYTTAEHIGDKIHAMTNDPDDLFALAQVYFAAGNFGRTHHILVSNPHGMKSLSCRYLATLALIKTRRWEDALEVAQGQGQGQKEGANDADNRSTWSSTESSSASLSGGSSARSTTNSNNKASRRTRTRKDPVSSKNALSDDQLINGINLEASMLYLQGQIFTYMNSFDRAKQCYIDALKIDAKCYEAFDQLINYHLITPIEEWDLIKSLDFEACCADNADLVKSLYTIRLGKYMNIAEYEETTAVLEEDYNLQDNPDILLSKADLLFTRCNFKECLKLCEAILRRDKYKLSVMPNYLSCLHELHGRNKLFLLAHELTNDHPDEPVTWLAVGIYYLTIDKVADARRYFSKASMMNPYFGQAWIGFAHTFAIEGEHEQAISAYSTAARLFQGTHLPSLFLGMQHLLLNNLSLAEDYLNSSFSICQTDPLVLNELGVVAYHKNDLGTAETQFLKALEAAKKLDSELSSWLSIQANLGHVYRRLEVFDKAKMYFEHVLTESPRDANIHSSLGLVNLQMGNTQAAVICFHDALALSPNDSVATDLLKRALEEHAQKSLDNLIKRTDLDLMIDNYDDDEDDGAIDYNDPELADIVSVPSKHNKQNANANPKTPELGSNAGSTFRSPGKSRSPRSFRHTPASPEQFYRRTHHTLSHDIDPDDPDSHMDLE